MYKTEFNSALEQFQKPKTDKMVIQIQTFPTTTRNPTLIVPSHKTKQLKVLRQRKKAHPGQVLTSLLIA
jgi:hypothetical protein